MKDSKHPLLKHTRAWFGGTEVNIPQQNMSNQIMQVYQAIANTGGPYANLAANLTPYYGQIGLGNLQQQLFGFNTSGAPGSIGTPASPAGGFYGAPAPAAPGGQFPTSGPTTGPMPAGGSPVGSSAGYTGPQGQLYSPSEGTPIGLGPDNAFFDPYQGQPTAAGAPGYHPGVLGLNTTALGAYGGAATDALLGSNPYLAGGLNSAALAQFDASNPLQGSDILRTLNSQANSDLEAGGALSGQEERDQTQAALASLGQGGLTHGNTGIAVDLLSRDSAIRQRQQQAQQFAAMVQGLNSAQQGQELQRIGIAGNLGNQSAQTATSGITNSIMQLLGLGNLNTNANPSTTIGDQNQLFNPFQQLGNQIALNNGSANANSAIANANASAAQNAGIMNLIGQIGGGLLGGSGYGFGG